MLSWLYFLRPFLPGLCGGLAWQIGLIVFFGPVQSILADPQRQSAKMLSVFGPQPPLPRMYEKPWVLWVGLLGIGLLYGFVYSAFWGRSERPWWRCGMLFGLLAWVLMVPWFEFYLPWNVLREPTSLVALEILCWAAVLQLVGLTIAGVDRGMDALILRQLLLCILQSALGFRKLLCEQLLHTGRAGEVQPSAVRVARLQREM